MLRHHRRRPVQRQRALSGPKGGSRAPAAQPALARAGEPVALRWILVRLTGETARRNGYIGILREMAGRSSRPVGKCRQRPGPPPDGMLWARRPANSAGSDRNTFSAGAARIQGDAEPPVSAGLRPAATTASEHAGLAYKNTLGTTHYFRPERTSRDRSLDRARDLRPSHGVPSRSSVGALRRPRARAERRLCEWCF
jgi:hypothetical protein